LKNQDILLANIVVTEIKDGMERWIFFFSQCVQNALGTKWPGPSVCFSSQLHFNCPFPPALNWLCPNSWKMCLWPQLFILHPCLVVDKQVTLILNHCLLVLRWSRLGSHKRFWTKDHFVFIHFFQSPVQIPIYVKTKKWIRVAWNAT